MTLLLIFEVTATYQATKDVNDDERPGNANSDAKERQTGQILSKREQDQCDCSGKCDEQTDDLKKLVIAVRFGDELWVLGGN